VAGTAFELAVLLAGVACAVDAVRSEARWRALLAGAFLYAVAFEWAVTTDASGGFGYRRFLVHGPGGAPLWVPVGWACLLYAATRTAERWDARPRWLVAAALVGAVGWQLDPVAVARGWWGWSEPGRPLVLGVPTGTHLAWVLVGLAYAPLTERHAARGVRVWQPLIAAPLALGVVAALAWLLDGLGAAVGHVATLALVQVVVFGGAAVALLRAGLPSARPRPLVLVVPAIAGLGAVALAVGHGPALIAAAASGAATLAVHGAWRVATPRDGTPRTGTRS